MFLTHSKHIFILGPKCLMHYSAELSETLRHWCRNVLGPKYRPKHISVNV